MPVTLLSAVEAVPETPVDRFLAEQADLTAVERFTQRHEADASPRQARYYRDLIPLVRPEAGQQYGFEVDLDACTGCKSCVAACHSLNGLDEGESWRSVTLLSGGTAERPFQQTVTAACHHCVDPACLIGCPVDAYEKDPVTGIVAHLDDQCIGCGYCTLSCPYEVPLYNKARGIVRKCDMCSGRLAAGEAPACVQACPNGAIAVKVVDVGAVAAASAAGSLVPGAPPSAITVPTTTYRSVKGWVHGAASGPSTSGPARAHTPLAVMLVLTQLSVGAFITDLVMREVSPASSAGAFDAIVAVAAGVLALGASVFHLGRPRYCYRAVIGLGHSWISREVVAFGGFTALAALDALLLGLGTPTPGISVTAVGSAAALFGLAGVMCSVLIYTTTRRSSWHPALVTTKFLLSAATCGLATVLWATVISSRHVTSPLPISLAALASAKLIVDASSSRSIPSELRPTRVRRVAAGILGGVLLPVVGATTAPPGWLGVAVATAILGGVVGGELLERSLFFTAASPPR
ncbi:MAG: dimethyl sulfoxide reductase anchor subunit [Acidimicrobiia bacterium]|nr:dimethyl sulfoxide reductase anchor subunit [Acidimicrobiia bacterium]